MQKSRTAHYLAAALPHDRTHFIMWQHAAYRKQ